MMKQEFVLACDADTAQATLSDPDFIVQRSLDLGELSAEAEVEERDDGIVVTQWRRVQRDLPAALRKVFKPEQDMTVTETWSAYDDGSWSCEQVVDIEGQPVTIHGDIEIEPTEAGCVYRIEQRAKVGIPILGRSVERYVLGEAKTTVARETEYLQQVVGDG
jgi:hypothetical protein